MRWMATLGIGMMSAGAAQAGETPLYQPAPDWVKPAPPITAVQLAPSAPLLVRNDEQSRLQKGQEWHYVDRATRIASAQVLAQGGTLTVPWQPANGDLIVHQVEIVRGDRHIDLLAGGKRLAVIRREQQLERQAVDGVLTATMPIEGLQIGDILHVVLSTTDRDPTLKGQVNTVSRLPVAPFRVSYVRTRLSWPVGERLNWKSYGEGANPVVTTAGGWQELVLEGTLPKQPEMPKDAPVRFNRPPIIDTSSFADWAAVAGTMAPLYATDGLIAPGSPLAAEVAAIRAADTDPLRRAAAALALVQDKIRYLFNGMNGGNYTPQAPAQTWAVRYGDCKAKTLLLLALLRALDIEAEAVLAPAQAGDVFDGRLPTPAAFDHVLVRATVGGESLWLDGTGSGTRLATIRDLPHFRTVLPVRATGAVLTVIPYRPDAQPDGDATVDLDQRAGITLPTMLTATVKLRGAMAASMGLMAEQAAPEQRRAIVDGLLHSIVGPARIASSTVAYDRDSGIATITAKGTATGQWSSDRDRQRMTLDHMVSQINFNPDRARPKWQGIPVSLRGRMDRIVQHTRVHLPQGGRGFTLKGDPTLDDTITGRAITRRVTMADGVVTVDEDGAPAVREIPAADLPAVRARLALAKARVPELVAPADLPSSYATAMAARKNGALAPMLALFAQAIANEPDKAQPYIARARFQESVYDRAAAIDDLGKALAIDPDAATYLWRARLYGRSGDAAKQRADIEQAIALDPADRDTMTQMANWLVDHGKADDAVAMMQERIDAGGKDAAGFLSSKALILSRAGRGDEALAAIDQAVAESPATASLLNQRCWIKGTLNVQLASALQDCSRSIELGGSQNIAALDSRAMAYFRMNRLDDALVDLAAALDKDPQEPGSLYMRGVILTRQGKAAAAADALAAARAIWPQVDREYGRWGIKP